MTTPAEIPTAITIDESLTGAQQTRGYAPDAAEHLPHFRALSATLLAIALTVTERSL